MIQRSAKHVHQARRGRAGGDLAGSHRQESLCLGGSHRVFGQPATVAVVLAREVDQDGIGVGDGHLAVLQHRHLAKAVLGEKLLALVSAGGQVDIDQFGIDAQQRQEQLGAVGMP